MKKIFIFIILVLMIGFIFVLWQEKKWTPHEVYPTDFSSNGNQITLSFQFSEEEIVLGSVDIW